MECRSITQQAAWETFVRAHAPRSGAFLQSWAWGEFQEALGRTLRRHGWEENGRLAGVAQTIVHPLPLAHAYAYVPRGPLTARGWSNEETYERLREIGAREDAAFVRFEPPWPAYPVRKHFIRTRDTQPPDTLLTRLNGSVDERLASRRAKTRYNVRLAARKGVQTDAPSEAALDDVWPLFEATARRDKFHLHPKAYYETMLSVLSGAACRAFLAVARLEGEILAANVMIDYLGTRTYLHGASSDAHREAMAPYALHHALMEDAARRGLKAYDWWGIAPESAGDRHPLAGVTRFKLGFGGTRVSYPGTFDAVLHPARYGLYVLGRRARRMV